MVRGYSESSPQGLYDHHMLVAEVIGSTLIKVIHYTGEVADAAADSMSSFSSFSSGAGASGSVAAIIEQEVEVQLDKETVEVLEYPDHFESFSPSEILERARSRLGEKAYGLLNNNCECFVNWAAIGQDTSNQSGGAKWATAFGFVVGAVKGYWNEGTFTGAMKGGVNSSTQSYQNYREHRP